MTTIDNPLSIYFVPLDKVILHEQTEPRRVERLVRRLVDEGILANPPIVAKTADNYVVLDGATRVTALKQLNFPHIIVHVVSPENGLGLQTWLHIIRVLEVERLLNLLHELPELVFKEISPQDLDNEALKHGSLCYIYTVEDRVFLVYPAAGVSDATALNKLTGLYMEAGVITRTLENDFAKLRVEFPDITALVVYPKYTVAQILQIAQAGQVVPAGITRFIIPGRVLRVNVDLDYLKADLPLSEKNEWLRQFVIDKLKTNRARYYAEPVYLLDE
jgi:hypothetical protein